MYYLQFVLIFGFLPWCKFIHGEDDQGKQADLTTIIHLGNKETSLSLYTSECKFSEMMSQGMTLNITCAVLSHSVVSDSLQPHGLQTTRLLCPCNSLGKNTRVGCHALLQGIFPIQGSNPSLLHCRQILYHLSHQGSKHHLISRKYELFTRFCSVLLITKYNPCTNYFLHQIIPSEIFLSCMLWELRI